MRSDGLRWIAAMGMTTVLLAMVVWATNALAPRRADGGEPAKPSAIAPDLLQALRTGDARALKASLDRGADPKARDAAGNTPLILAALYATPECLELLLQRGADVHAAGCVSPRAGAQQRLWRVRHGG